MEQLFTYRKIHFCYHRNFPIFYLTGKRPWSLDLTACNAFNFKVMTSQIDSITYIRFEISNCTADVDLPGAPLTYFNDGGVRRIFLGLTFWPKGIFLVYERRRDFFGSRKQHRDFLGYCIFHQLKSTIT